MKKEEMSKKEFEKVFERIFKPFFKSKPSNEIDNNYRALLLTAQSEVEKLKVRFLADYLEMPYELNSEPFYPIHIEGIPYINGNEFILEVLHDYPDILIKQRYLLYNTGDIISLFDKWEVE